MNRTVVGVITTTLVIFIYGFLFWEVNTLPYDALQQTSDDVAAQAMLKSHFPSSGSYYIPGRQNSETDLIKLTEQGPVGFVHIDIDGKPAFDPAVMVRGLVLNLLFVCLLAGLFKITRATEFRDFARTSLVAGAAAVLLIDGGNIVWWSAPINWQIWLSIYHFTSFVIAGHLLGIFMKTKASTIG
ncbi:MAG: hypothetical protein QNL96_15355 [SAR86 cluster bacterium]|jgi:hypothetical protein|uniref:Uncharacterized protein n=1 Tax=SAR86 cluster bacterium TaxID=2030880 RepID=A0A972W024_9GAMM|nr:hypothetical protein [SAR86 cluster bacterium]